MEYRGKLFLQLYMRILNGADTAKSNRVMKALLEMSKLDIETLRQA